MTTSASNERPRAIGVPVGVERAAAAVEDEIVVAAELVHVERPARRVLRAMLPSISSRRACLPTVNGDADRLTIAGRAGARRAPRSDRGGSGAASRSRDRSRCPRRC